MKISETASQKIRNMSLLCAILVVSIHIEWTHDQMLSVGWFISEIVKDGVARIAVPFFFVVSGFFLAQHFDDQGWWKRENVKRIKSLAVPFILWALIGVIATTPLSIIADVISGRHFGTSIFWLHSDFWQSQGLAIFGFDLTEHPHYYPLWYIRCLFLFVLTGLIFKLGVCRFRYWWFGATFVLMLFVRFIPCESSRKFLISCYSVEGIFYFSIGIFVQRCKTYAHSRKPMIVCGIFGLLLLVLRILFSYYAWRGQSYLTNLAIPCILYFVWGCMTAKRLPEWLTSCSFPIFLSHVILIHYFSSWFKRLLVPEIWAAFITFIGSVGLSIGLTLLLRRYTPRLASVLFGGR